MSNIRVKGCQGNRPVHIFVTQTERCSCKSWLLYICVHDTTSHSVNMSRNFRQDTLYYLLYYSSSQAKPGTLIMPWLLGQIFFGAAIFVQHTDSNNLYSLFIYVYIYLISRQYWFQSLRVQWGLKSQFYIIRKKNTTIWSQIGSLSVVCIWQFRGLKC